MINLIKMNKDIIKLNARGTIVYVDNAILTKSPYFQNLLFGENFKSSVSSDDSYYIDCDHDIIVEIIAFLETGHLKYNKINSEYIGAIFDKFCIGNKIDYKEQNNFCIKILNDIFERIIERYEYYANLKKISMNCKSLTLINILFVETLTDDYDLKFMESFEGNYKKFTSIALYNKNKLNLSDSKIIEFIKNQIIYFINECGMEFDYYMKSITKSTTDVLNIEIYSF